LTDTEKIIEKVLEVNKMDTNVTLSLIDHKHGRILEKQLTTKEIILISAVVSGTKWRDIPPEEIKINE
jgi:hypothetical protein